MQRVLLAAVLSLPTLMAPAHAQMQPQTTPEVVPQGQALAKAAIVRCGQLIAAILSSPGSAGVTVEQAREWEEHHEIEKCTEATQRVMRSSAPPAR